MKHRLKNIANRVIPLDDGTRAAPGEIVEVEMTQRNCYLVKNKFYEDLGEVKEAPKKKDKKKDKDKGEAKSEYDKADSPEKDEPRDDFEDYFGDRPREDDE